MAPSYSSAIFSRLCLLSLGLTGVLGEWSVAHDPLGTEQFITRPEIVAPRYMVAKHHPDSITPGYWFVSPYSEINSQVIQDRKQYIPCQTGAHIYDSDGSLVWSGACQFENRNVFNFKPVNIKGEQHLSFWLETQRVGNDVPQSERKASGVVLNNQYEEVLRTRDHDAIQLDSHEYSIQDDGATVLITTNWFPQYEAKELNQGQRPIINNGFRLMELATNKVLFDWRATDHGVLLNESCDIVNMQKPEALGHWDWFHINSVEKSMTGDFLISSRHTHAIYKISGKDGSVIWRLGGCYGQSDFVMDDDVPFQWQHHARWRSENETHTIISLFDNGGEPFDLNPNIPDKPSTAKVIILDTASRPMTAKLLRKLDKPDGGTTPFLGSLQQVSPERIESANVLVNWAREGHISEYDGEGRMVLEAQFATDRQRTYRAYKYPFVGHPTESPAFKILPLGYASDELASAFYVSWNGATEVKTWAFWGGSTPTGPFKKLVSTPKRGFETSWVTPGVVKYAFAVALDVNGKELGRSGLTSILPSRQGEMIHNAPVWDNTTSLSIQEQHGAASSVNGTDDLVSAATSPSSSRSFKQKLRTLPHDNFLNILSNVFLGAFALYGAYSMAYGLRQRMLVRRKGYKSLNGYVDFPE